MKKIFSLSFLLILVIFSSCGGSKKIINENNQSIQFTSHSHDISNDMLKVILNVDSAQKASDEGLKFSIKLVNTSGKTIDVRNITDVLSMSLMNERGEDVLFPYVSNIYINSKGKSASSPSFNYRFATINGSRTGWSLSERTITIPANSSFEIFLSITQMLKLGTQKPYKTEDTQPLQNGRYRLSLNLVLDYEGKQQALAITPTTINYY